MRWGKPSAEQIAVQTRGLNIMWKDAMATPLHWTSAVRHASPCDPEPTFGWCRNAEHTHGPADADFVPNRGC